MGAFLDKPKTEKYNESRVGGGLRYGLSSMQVGLVIVMLMVLLMVLPMVLMVLLILLTNSCPGLEDRDGGRAQRSDRHPRPEGDRSGFLLNICFSLF